MVEELGQSFESAVETLAEGLTHGQTAVGISSMPLTMT
jgi:hypothetical protein